MVCRVQHLTMGLPPLCIDRVHSLLIKVGWGLGCPKGSPQYLVLLVFGLSNSTVHACMLLFGRCWVTCERVGENVEQIDGGERLCGHAPGPKCLEEYLESTLVNVLEESTMVNVLEESTVVNVSK